MAAKLKKCKSCGELFEPWSTLAVACGPKCAIEWHRTQEAKKRRREQREARERLKTRSDWMKDAQRAFNAFVRERDRDEPCICCGKWTSDDGLITGSRWDAGHYRSIGAAPHLRFNEDNCHRQKVRCNREKSGNAVEYRLRLIAKIGLPAVEALEADQSVRKYTIDDLKAIRAEYRAKLKSLKSEREKCFGAAGEN